MHYYAHQLNVWQTLKTLLFTARRAQRRRSLPRHERPSAEGMHMYLFKFKWVGVQPTTKTAAANVDDKHEHCDGTTADGAEASAVFASCKRRERVCMLFTVMTILKSLDAILW